MTHLNLDIKPHHVRKGAAATKRAREREKRTQATPVPPTPKQRNSGPSSAPESAIADLCRVLGYPNAAIQTPKGRVHRIVVEADEKEPDWRPAVVRKGWEGRYRVLDGVRHKVCPGCDKWLPLTEANYVWRVHKGIGSWASQCHPCVRRRRREIWAERHPKKGKQK